MIATSIHGNFLLILGYCEDEVSTHADSFIVGKTAVCSLTEFCEGSFQQIL